MFLRMRWRIAIPYMVLILVAMAVLSIYLSHIVRDTYLDDLEVHLATEARLIGDVLASSGAAGVDGASGAASAPTWDGSGGNYDALARRYAELLIAHVAIIGADGTVLGESEKGRNQVGNQLYRPEVQQALAEGQGSSLRSSGPDGSDIMYVAVPVVLGDRVSGFVRVALPLSQVEANVARLRRAILSAALLAALGVVVLAILVAERTARPVRQLTEVVRRVAEGDLSARLLPTTNDEVGTLTRSFNQMSDRLRGTIAKLVEERNRLTTVLDNMADGVIITDGDGRVRLINPAAARLLGIDEEVALARPFAQVARDHQIIELWQQCYEQREEQFESVELSHQGVFLQAIVTPLQEAGPQASLVILQDLTRIRRLETVRRDFISNISHELRTPLASLRAVVDTLRDGALADPPAAERFLNRMDIEVDALAQMVRELLELSRIESGQVPFRLKAVSVEEVVGQAVERLRPQAERAELTLSVDLSPDLPPVLADVERAQQVITNLVHNAIKFTPAGGRVHVSGYSFRISSAGDVQPEGLSLDYEALTSGDWVLISVEDTGVGISASDLPRIFERFYKADRARSGGGTGLGLAIAKHIVQVHGGHIWAKSVEGQGSTFQVALPALT